VEGLRGLSLKPCDGAIKECDDLRLRAAWCVVEKYDDASTAKGRRPCYESPNSWISVKSVSRSVLKAIGLSCPHHLRPMRKTTSTLKRALHPTLRN
jgi:hypothetical protein